MGQFKYRFTARKRSEKKRFITYRSNKSKLLESLSIGRYVKLYHWWDEPDGAIRKILSSCLHPRIKEAMRKLEVKNLYQLAKKKGVSPGKVSIIRDWLRQTPAVSAKTGVLKRILGILDIPYEVLERYKAIVDREFPINLYSEAMVRLYTHVLNEGSLIKGKNISSITLRYVNQDPVLIRKFIDTVKEVGGRAYILPPQKPGFDVSVDTLTGRLLHAAGLPFGRKTLSDLGLHPRVLIDPEMAKQHLHITFLEEGFVTFSYGRDNRLQLIVGLGRSLDVTDKIPKPILQELLKYKGRKVQPTKFFSYNFIKKVLLPNAPLALHQEYDLVSELLQLKYSVARNIKFVVSYLHISNDNRVTANYKFSMRSREAINLFKNIVLSNPYGAWKEYRFSEMLKIYEKYKGRSLTLEEMKEIKKMTPPSHIPEEWVISKAQELLG
ncbi:MAG: hypothetical protein DRJ64_06460, partial [Thermoprotei archaeon]